MINRSRLILLLLTISIIISSIIKALVTAFSIISIIGVISSVFILRTRLRDTSSFAGDQEQLFWSREIRQFFFGYSQSVIQSVVEAAYFFYCSSYSNRKVVIYVEEAVVDSKRKQGEIIVLFEVVNFDKSVDCS